LKIIYWAMFKFRNGCIWICLGLTVVITNAQSLKQGSQWHLGYHMAIDFTYEPPFVSNNSAIVTVGEQPSSICDENGKLLFYTNGATVWNRNHEVMLNGDSITSIRYLLTTSSVIIPHPGDGQLYYIFIANPWNGPVNEGIHYSVVDMSGDGGYGEVIQKRNNLVSIAGEGLSVVADSEDKGFWVIGHGLFNNNYYAYKITETGISPPIISTIGIVWNMDNVYQ